MENKPVLQAIMPITGKTIPLTEVPDPVFSEKMLGDGIAILPADGEIYSPIDGEITMIAATKHAFGITTANGIELLLHFGLETVHLDGSAFDVKVTADDKVKAGQLLAIADCQALGAAGIDMVTPLVICKAPDNIIFDFTYGDFVAGSETIIHAFTQNNANNAKDTLTDASTNLINTTNDTTPTTKASAININFDALQKLGKTLITVIAVMPAAGLMISLGKLLQMSAEHFAPILATGSTMENIG